MAKLFEVMCGERTVGYSTSQELTFKEICEGCYMQGSPRPPHPESVPHAGDPHFVFVAPEIMRRQAALIERVEQRHPERKAKRLRNELHWLRQETKNG